jgi:hypothetical protein
VVCQDDMMTSHDDQLLTWSIRPPFHCHRARLRQLRPILARRLPAAFAAAGRWIDEITDGIEKGRGTEERGFRGAAIASAPVVA